MIFGGRASFLPTNVDHTAAILHKGMLEVHPQLAGYRVEYAWGGNVGFTFDRMPHVGRKDGITYAMGCCGTGVALMTALGTAVGGVARRRTRRRPSSQLSFPLVPAPVRGPAVVPAVRGRVVPAPGPARPGRLAVRRAGAAGPISVGRGPAAGRRRFPYPCRS